MELSAFGQCFKRSVHGIRKGSTIKWILRIPEDPKIEAAQQFLFT